VKWREQANALLQKARQDLYMMRAHQNDPHVSDETWGFHAQQAVEKLLKAILSYRQVQYPFTHRLRVLAELLHEAGADLPECFEPLLDLTPYAAELRYSVLPRDPGEKPLDRTETIKLMTMLEKHVADTLSV
jgi:HEPN domain-containing protein